MARELNICPTPFRDALMRLRQNRYIDILPSRGFCLHVIGREEVLQTFQVRMALEGFCALALLKRQETPQGKLTLRQLTQILDQMDTLSHVPEQMEAFVRLDTAFHQLLIDFVANREFQALFASHVHQIAVLAGESLLQPNRARDTVQEHGAILQAIPGPGTSGLLPGGGTTYGSRPRDQFGADGRRHTTEYHGIEGPFGVPFLCLCQGGS